ncbi:MAG: glycoside hydrolase family 127 protein [Acidobacteria bacterium]|nr:glycoside hydrolase family 127 protein [Acidobacteriota bacterium]
MTNNPERLPGTEGCYRVYFGACALPRLAVWHSQWDYGDCTARSITAWICAREMLGDPKAGDVVERGQKQFLLSFFNPDTGLVYVPELSDLKSKKHYYNVWDQGRTLRALVQWYVSLAHDPGARAKIKERIKKMIDGLGKLPVYGGDPIQGVYAVFKSDVYFNRDPHFPVNVWVWGGQLIEPLVMWFEATGDQGALRFAKQITSGILSGHQSDGYTGETKRALEFGPDGSFTSHFHNRSSTVLGVVKMGEALCRNGDRTDGIRLIRWAKKVYDWIFDPRRNVNAAGAFGWFPENMDDGTQARVVNETCCTADMIELAVELAKTSRLDPELSSYSALWDDAERFTRNGLLKAQFTVTPEYQKLLEQVMASAASMRTEGIPSDSVSLPSAKPLEGGWADSFHPNEMTRLISQTNTPLLGLGGCCQYSGIRGAYACWKNILTKQGKNIFINMAIDRDSKWARVRSYLPSQGRIEINVRVPSNVYYRLPVWTDPQSVRVSVNGKSVAPLWNEPVSGYLGIPDLKSDDLVTISYSVPRTITKEKIGGNNSGDGLGFGFCDPSDKIEYTLTWVGNDVVDIEPQGKYLALFNLSH